MQDGSVCSYVFELSCVDLHHHVNSDDAEEIEAAMPVLGERSWDVDGVRFHCCGDNNWSSLAKSGVSESRHQKHSLV